MVYSVSPPTARETDPHVWTDYNIYSGSSSAYLVYEEVFSVPSNINIAFQRTGNDGTLWKDFAWIMGTTSSDELIDPHGCFGENNSHYLFVTAYDKTAKTILLSRCTDWGAGTWGADQSLYTLTKEPVAKAVGPSIAAATEAGRQNLLLFFATGTVAGDDDPQYILSLNSGADWSGPYSAGATTDYEYAPLVTATPQGGCFHVVFTRNHDVFHIKRTQGLGSWSTGSQVNRGGLASHGFPYKAIACEWRFGFPVVAWLDYYYDDPINADNYAPFTNRLVPDDLMANWTAQGVFFRTDNGVWKKLADDPGQLVAAGDVDGDGTADLIGVWAADNGVWVRKSSDLAWIKIGSIARDIAAGDMDGDGTDEVLGTWNGQGVYYKSQISGGTWTLLASPATLIATGDLDGDNRDDLIGIWPGQGGVWVKYSNTATWSKLSTTSIDLAAGAMRGGQNSWFAKNAVSGSLATQSLKPNSSNSLNFSDKGPGGSKFRYKVQRDLVPRENPGIAHIPGPGEPGFTYSEQQNLFPMEMFNKEKGPE